MLITEDVKEEHKKAEDEEDVIVPYDSKCRKVHIFFSKQQKDLIK